MLPNNIRSYNVITITLGSWVYLPKKFNNFSDSLVPLRSGRVGVNVVLINVIKNILGNIDKYWKAFTYMFNVRISNSKIKTTSMLTYSSRRDEFH